VIWEQWTWRLVSDSLRLHVVCFLFGNPSRKFIGKHAVTSGSAQPRSRGAGMGKAARRLRSSETMEEATVSGETSVTVFPIEMAFLSGPSSTTWCSEKARRDGTAAAFPSWTLRTIRADVRKVLGGRD